MMILALEFSSSRRSVALARDSEVLTEVIQESDDHATKAFGMINKVLMSAKIAREEVNLIAVGLGPGSYTGIRAAIAIAQGWQVARGVKVTGISSAECLAVQAQTENIHGTVNVIIDAQRREFYLARWEISAAERHEFSPLTIVPATEIEARAGEMNVGPQADKIMFPAAATVASLAAARGPYSAGGTLAPIYLRETTFVKAPSPRQF